MEYKEISRDLIIEPEYDVRQYISREELEELADSIKSVGILVPLRVFEKDGVYEIEDGHRRFLASGMCQLQILPCFVVSSEAEQRDLKKLHANVHSEKLSPLEMGITLRDVMKTYGYTRDELAQLMGKSTSRINQLLALLNLPEDLQVPLLDRRISEPIARELRKLDDYAKRHYYLEYIYDGGATINMVKAWVAREIAILNEPEYPGLDYSGPPQDVHDYQYKRRCGCCRSDFVPDALLMIYVCPECYADLVAIMPDMYKVFKETRGGPEHKTENVVVEDYVFPDVEEEEKVNGNAGRADSQGESSTEKAEDVLPDEYWLLP